MSAGRTFQNDIQGPRTSGHRPARYLIRVQGAIDARWCDRLSGMVVTDMAARPGEVTSLSGELVDQAALLGVLNSLYNLGLPIVTVERLGCPEQSTVSTSNEPG
jgi:hypothetical protein